MNPFFMGSRKAHSIAGGILAFGGILFFLLFLGKNRLFFYLLEHWKIPILILFGIPFLYHIGYGFFILYQSSYSLPIKRNRWKGFFYLFQRFSAAILLLCGLILYLFTHNFWFLISPKDWQNLFLQIMAISFWFFLLAHMFYGIWLLFLRWGITLSQRSQALFRWVCLLGFLSFFSMVLFFVFSGKA